MARVPVKLSRKEIVLPPSIARQHMARLKEMNAMGLQARAAGGVVQYRQEGGGIQNFLNNPATGQLGEFLHK